MTKVPTPTDKSKKQRDNIKNATKTFDYATIADRLRRSVGVTAVTPLVWLNRFTGAQPSHSVVNCIWRDRYIDYNTNRLSQR